MKAHLQARKQPEGWKSGLLIPDEPTTQSENFCSCLPTLSDWFFLNNAFQPIECCHFQYGLTILYSEPIKAPDSVTLGRLSHLQVGGPPLHTLCMENCSITLCLAHSLAVSTSLFLHAGQKLGTLWVWESRKTVYVRKLCPGKLITKRQFVAFYCSSSINTPNRVDFKQTWENMHIINS